MPHPVLFPKKTFFYPIGNTSAVCLTRDLPPDVPADVLLLGCGDVRNVLYTIYADAPTRNVVLLSLLADRSWDQDTRLLWNIHYHFFIDKPSSNVLRNHCRKLVEASETSETWSRSCFGGLVKFSTNQTLQELRSYWIKYLNFEDLPEKRKRQLKHDFVEGMRKNSRTTASSFTTGSAGVYWKEALPIVESQFRRFWSSGTTFDTSNENAAAIHLNPTFVYSRTGEGFNFVHYSSDPLCSFHLEEPFLSAEPGRPPSVQAVIGHAKKEFRDWCIAFHQFISKPCHDIILRFFSGDALALCQAMKTDDSLRRSPSFATSWTWSPISLEDGPRVFDVIDTSNLLDHLGLMNVLAVAVPLLRPCASSTLRTDSLHVESMHSFESRFAEDISTVSLLLDITPVPYSSGFKTNGAHPRELYDIHHVQPHTEIYWRRGSCYSPDTRMDSVTVSFTPAQLTPLLFQMYLKLFSDHEGHDYTAQFNNLLNYSRATFVLLVEIIRRHVHTDWKETLDRFVHTVANDNTLLLGHGYYEELRIELYVRDMYRAPDWASSTFMSRRNPRFKGWNDVPLLVAVLLKIPRERITLLTDHIPLESGSPALQCNVEGSMWLHSFTSIQFMFGSVAKKTGPPSDSIRLLEDPLGWRGTSDLIMALYVPSWMLSLDPNTTFVGLNVRSTYGMSNLRSVLGDMRLSVYKALVSDVEHVFISSKYPDIDTSSLSYQQREIVSTTVPSSSAVAETSSSKPTALTVRVECTAGASQSRLSEGAKVSVKQVSAVEMRVDIGDTKKYLQFPAFMDGDRSRLRIARKSCYVEVIAPLDTRHRNPFPLVINKMLQPASAWNMHYVHLAKLPTLTSSESSFIEKHFATMFSDAEVIALKKYNDGILSETDPFLSFRATLKSMCFQAVGQKFDAIQLEELGGSRKYLLFVGDTYRDVQCHSVVVSAFVIPVSIHRTDELSPGLPDERINSLEIGAKEMDVWERAIPAFSERCRSWKHREDCIYLDAVRSGQAIWCDCGFGDVPSEVAAKWPNLYPHMKQVAISPIHSLPSTKGKVSSLTSPIRGVEIDKCAACHTSSEKLLICSRCKATKYCSASCQKSDWKVHKKICK